MLNESLKNVLTKDVIEQSRAAEPVKPAKSSRNADRGATEFADEVERIIRADERRAAATEQPVNIQKSSHRNAAVKTGAKKVIGAESRAATDRNRNIGNNNEIRKHVAVSETAAKEFKANESGEIYAAQYVPTDITPMPTPVNPTHQPIEGAALDVRNSQASELISSALAEISSMLTLPSAVTFDEQSLIRFDQESLEQFAEILHALESIGNLLDKVAVSGEVLDVGGINISADESAMLSADLRVEKFHIQMGLSMIGAREIVSDIVAEKYDAQLQASGISQAADPASLGMSAVDTARVFGSLTEEDLTAAIERIKLAKGGQTESADDAQDTQVKLTVTDSQDMRTMFKSTAVTPKTAAPEQINVNNVSNVKVENVKVDNVKSANINVNNIDNININNVKTENVNVNNIKPEQVKIDNVEPEAVKAENVNVNVNNVKPEQVKPVNINPEQVKVDSVEPESVKVENVNVNNVKPEQVNSEDIKVDNTVKSDSVNTNNIKPEQAKAEDIKVEQTKAEDVKVEQVKAENIKAQDVKSENVKTENVDVDNVVKADNINTNNVKPEQINPEYVRAASNVKPQFVIGKNEKFEEAKNVKAEAVGAKSETAKAFNSVELPLSVSELTAASAKLRKASSAPSEEKHAADFAGVSVANEEAAESVKSEKSAFTLSGVLQQNAATASESEGVELADVVQVDVAQVKAQAAVEHVEKAASAFSRVDNEAIIRQITEKMHHAVRNGVQEVRMVLRPEALGEVRMSLRVEGDVVLARIQVENSQVKAIVESQLQNLKDSLEQQNLHAGAFSVDVGSDRDRSPREAWQELAEASRKSKFREGGVERVGASEVESVGSVAAGSDTGRRFGNNTFELFI